MKKRILIALCIVGIVIGIFSVRAGVSGVKNKKSDEEYFLEGVKLIAFELREYIDTNDENSFHRAATDVQYLSEEMNFDLGSDFNKEAFAGIVEAFAYSEGKLRSYAQRLAEAFELIAENPKDEYPYSQFNIVLNSIS